MNKLLILITLLLVLFNTNAQVPQKMSYQAVIRNQNNALLANTKIAMKISIIQNDSLQYPVFQEYHTGTTNLNGLVSLQIGTGSVLLGDFKNIDWSKGPYYVKTETDPDGGFDFRITGTSELLTVPYAFYALNNTVSFDTTSLHTRINDLQFQAAINKINIQKNLDSIKDNAKDIKNNLDTIKYHGLEIDNNIINIKSNSVQIENNIDSINTKIDVLDLIAILSSYQKIGKIINAISVNGMDSFDVKTNGSLTSSKNISLMGNIESLGSNSTLGTLEKPFKDLFISSHSLSIASDVVGANTPATVLSNVDGNLQISAGGLKLMGENASFIAPRIISTLTGNASTATKLNTARNINGIPFDGSSDIIIATTSNSNLTGVVTSEGNTTSIASGAITNSMLANTAVSNLSGSNTGDQVLPTLVSLGAVAKNLSITGATKTKITYDIKGLVTTGADATTADIAASANKNYLTDAQSTILSNTSGTNSGDQTNITGNAATATKLTGPLVLASINEPEKPEIDLTVSIHILNDKIISTLSPTKSELEDGEFFKKFIEANAGKILYFIPDNKLEKNNLASIKIQIDKCAYWDGENLIIVPVQWQPFDDKLSGQTIATAIFTGEAWSLSGGVVTFTKITTAKE